MYSVKCNEKAMMLVTILMLTFLLVMLTTSMILITSQNLNITGLAENKSKALQAAEAGVEYAFYQLDSDSTWGQSITSDITEHIGNGESFTIVFSTSELYYSKNNLMNANPDGTTPGYAAEIISRGTYNGTTRLIRAVFLRDDEVPYPVCTEGDLFMRGYISGTMNVNSHGKASANNPSHFHSNKKINIQSTWGSNIAMNLNGGLISASSSITLADMTGPVNQKSGVLTEKIPDIDINGIISGRSSDPNICKTLPTNTFYLAGYFEFDPNVPYCIPHHPRPSDSWGFYDPNVHTSNYKIGIASFAETDCNSFLTNYNSFYTPLPPASPTRNFYNYYNPITFYEYPAGGTITDITNFNNNLTNSLGLSMTVDTEPATGKPRMTLNLEKDLYMPSSTGIFETTIMGGKAPVYLCPTKSVRLNFAGHRIYSGGKLHIGMPLYGTGTIASNDSVDFIQGGYDANMVILSNKSVRMLYREEPYNSGVVQLPYTGIIYAKDDILIESNSQWTGGNKYLIIKGAMMSKNNQPSVFEDSLMATYPLYFYMSYYRPDINFYIDGVTLDKLDIIHSTDGLDRLVALRGNNFKIRKQLYEVLK